jgi:uncharacterized membrane protein YcfT
MSVASAAGSTRIQWVDALRVVSILLVVGYHAGLYLENYGWKIGLQAEVNSALGTLRMPSFLLVSGLLASGAIASKSLTGLLRSRVALLAWLYLFWALVWKAWHSFCPLPFDLGDLPMALIVPLSGLWFFYGLALYNVLAWLMRGLPVPVQLLLAAGLHLAFSSGFISFGATYTWSSIGTNFVFFLTGVLMRDVILRAAEGVTPLRLIGATVAFALSIVAMWKLPYPLLGRFLSSLLGCAFGVALARMLTRSRQLADWGSFLGSRTLPLYVTHPLLLAAMCWKLPINAVSVWIAVPLLSAAAVAAGLGLHALVGRVPGVFSLPILRVGSSSA